MSVILRQTKELPAASAYDVWFAVTGTRATLDPASRVPDLGRRLEDAFDSIRDDWWALGRRLGATPSAKLAHAPTAAAYNNDLGLMMAWIGLAETYGDARERCLVVCDDPWLFRALAVVADEVGSTPILLPARIKLWIRGVLARSRVALSVGLAATRLRGGRSVFRTADPVLLVYGHPRSTADGFDAYFGTLMRDAPHLKRLLHADCPAVRARILSRDGRTASVHAWGSPWAAIGLITARWRPSANDVRGRDGWLVRRAVARENGTGAPAINRWQAHCQERWLASAQPACVVWPWENHPWERAMCRAARRAGVRAIGYQHTVIGPHQMNFSPATNPDGLDSIPDVILCNGPAFRDQLEIWGVPAGRLKIAGAFRIARFAPGHYDPDGPVYVALSSIPEISTQMMSALDNDRRYLVKEHPLYPFAFRESTNIQRTDRTIPEERGLSAVFYATGTSGLEALLAGIPTFRLLPADRISVDIMPEGVAAKDVTADRLADALDQIGPAPDIDWDTIFSSVDRAVWFRELEMEPMSSFDSADRQSHLTADEAAPDHEPSSRNVEAKA